MLAELPDLFSEDGHNLEKHGGEFKLLCPWHTEKTPSCSIFRRPEDQEWRYHCFGCGASGDDVEYLVQGRGLTYREALKMRDGDGEYQAKGQPVKKNTAPKQKKEREILQKLPGGYIARYRYYYIDGELAFVIQRYDIDGKKVFGQYTPQADGTWLKGLAVENNRPLYMLLDIADKPKTMPVMVVEGEKCADLVKAEFSKTLVVSWACGTGSVSLTDWSPLYGRPVNLVADSDAGGYLAMAKIARHLHKHCPLIKLTLPTITWPPENSTDIGDVIEKNPSDVPKWIGARVVEWSEKIDRKMTALEKKVEALRLKERQKKQMEPKIRENDNFAIVEAQGNTIRLTTPRGESFILSARAVITPNLLQSLYPDIEFWENVIDIKMTRNNSTMIGKRLFELAAQNTSKLPF